MGIFNRMFGKKEEQKPERQQAQTEAGNRPYISEEQKEAQQKEKLEKQIRLIKSRWDDALRKAQTKNPDKTAEQVITKSFMKESLNSIKEWNTADRVDPQQLYVAVKTAGRCFEVYDRQFPPEKGETGLSDLYRENLAHAVSGNRTVKSIIDSYLHEDPARNDSKDLMALRIYSDKVTEVIKRDAQLDIRKIPGKGDKKDYYEVSTKGGMRLADVKTRKQAEVLKKDIEAALRQGEELYDKPNKFDLEDRNLWQPKYAFGEDYFEDNFATVHSGHNYIDVDRDAEISVEPVHAWYVTGSALVPGHVSFTGKEEGYGTKIKDPKGFLYGYKIEAEGKTPFYENDTKIPVYTVVIDNHTSREQAEKTAYEMRSEIERKVRAGETIELTPEYEKDISDDIDRADGILSADDLSERAGIDPFAEMEDLCDIPIDQRIKNDRAKAARDNAGREEKGNTAERKEDTR